MILTLSGVQMFKIRPSNWGAVLLFQILTFMTDNVKIRKRSTAPQLLGLV